jgi:tRNA A-37 threonylcarbamoyl transferase component Bud32/tetratricopeptide (TPR) repeat protein/TolB-like protein
MTDRVAEVSAAIQGRYTLERELGRGGMATVYLAEDLKLHRRVALKLLHPELGATLGPERFLREIAIASRLTHPHILSLHDSGEAAGWLFYAMPYVEGESLRQRLQREPQLPVEETVRIVRAVASALEYAHHEGVVHRDIKPENILLANDTAGGPSHPLVVDFGIARALDAAGGERLTATGLALGTPSYMSPEQAAAGQIDGRSDIYALGCVAYEMLAGAPPFTGPTAQTIMARHAVDPVPSLRTVRRTVPAAIERAIEQALAKVPADRFATASEFADELAAEAAPTVALPPSSWRSARRRARRSLVLIAGIAGIAAIAAGAVAAIRWRGSSTLAVMPSAASIAVLPLAASTGDTALNRLGRDLATTVSASLDGVGGIQTADRLRVAQVTAERPINSPADAAALARRVNARSVLVGTLVGDGANVRLDLGLYDAQTVAPLAQGLAITAPRDSLGALTDSVVWAVLRQVWRRGAPPSPSLAAVTTKSLPALRAFLDGEREVERDRWDAARLAYRSAIAADSTFWLAHFRYVLTQYWQEQDVESGLLDALQRHVDVFPPRDRLLVEAWSEAARDSLPLQLDLYLEATRRFPDYWPGWFFFGDRLYHVGPLAGHDWRDARDALSRAVALNPRLKPAWMHLFFSNAGKDTIESGRALVRLLEFKRSEVPAEPIAQVGLRLIDAVGRSRGMIGPENSPLADSMARLYASPEAGAFHQVTWPWTFLWVGFPQAQISLNGRILRRRVNAASAAAQLRGIAVAWAERGDWDSALVKMRNAVNAEPDPATGDGPGPMDEYGLAVLGVWLGVVEPAAAVSRRPAARASINSSRDEGLSGDLAWLDGLLAYARRDGPGLARARAAARRSGRPDTAVIDRSLAAFQRALGGDRIGAGRELAALEWHCMSRGACELAIPSIAVHRLAAANWLLEAGDTAQAARLLHWHEAAIGGWTWSFSYAVTPLAYLMLARIEEAQGDLRSARVHYEQFLRRHDASLPKERHLVEEARMALVRVAKGYDSIDR